MFGERADLIQEAHRRIQAHPQRYVDHVYGETENGGTSYLILSHVPFEELGLPGLGPTPVKDVSEAVMGITIPFALAWGAVLTGVSIGVHARNQKRSTEEDQPAASEDGNGERQ